MGRQKNLMVLLLKKRKFCSESVSWWGSMVWPVELSIATCRVVNHPLS